MYFAIIIHNFWFNIFLFFNCNFFIFFIINSSLFLICINFCVQYFFIFLIQQFSIFPYDIKVNLRYTIGFEVLEILGSFYKKLTDNFSIPSLDPDSSFFYHLRLSDSFNTEQKVGFQLVVFYTDNFIILSIKAF